MVVSKRGHTARDCRNKFISDAQVKGAGMCEAPTEDIGSKVQTKLQQNVNMAIRWVVIVEAR